MKVLLLLSLLPQDAATVMPRGVTVLESRDLSARLLDADLLLEAGETRAALGLLQDVCESPPDRLVRVGPELLFRGAQQQAVARLATLSREQFAERERMFQPLAARALHAALTPPDASALAQVAARWPLTQAAETASRARVELLLDRGRIARALSLPASRALHESAPGWLADRPPVGPGTPLLIPAVSSCDDPALPGFDLHPDRMEFRWHRPTARPHWPRGYSGARVAAAHGMIWITDGKGVTAVDSSSGASIWEFDGHPAWERRTDAGIAALMEGFEPNTILAPVLADGRLLCVLQEPIELGRSDSRFGYAVRRYLPARRLYVFDADDGTLLWKQPTTWSGTEVEPRGIAAAPPAVADGRVFLPVYDAVGTVDLRLLAFDLVDGAPLWSSFLVSGQQESNLFGNLLREFAAAPPVCRDGSVVQLTQLGAVARLDAASGAVEWLRLYERTPVPESRRGEEVRRRATFANQPVAWDGKQLVFAPTDSPFAYSVDPVEGTLLEQFSARGANGSLRHLLALTEQGPLFLGHTAQQFGDAPWQSRRLRSRAIQPEWMLEGALLQNRILIPDQNRLLQVEPGNHGAVEVLLTWDEQQQAATVQLADDTLLLIRDDGVTAYGPSLNLVDRIAGLEVAGDLAAADRIRLREALRLVLSGNRSGADRMVSELLARVEDGPLLTPALLILEAALDPGAAPERHRSVLLRLRSRPDMLLEPPGRPEQPLALYVAWRLVESVDAAAAYEALLRLLADPRAGSFGDGEQSYEELGAEQLRRLLQGSEELRREHEHRAAAVLAALPATAQVSADDLRPWVASRALSLWLRRRADATEENATLQRILAWQRTLCPEATDLGDDLLGRTHFASPLPPSLPTALEVLAEVQPGGWSEGTELWLAAGTDAQGRPLLLTTRADTLYLRRFEFGEAVELARHTREAMAFPAAAFTDGSAVVMDGTRLLRSDGGPFASLTFPEAPFDARFDGDRLWLLFGGPRPQLQLLSASQFQVLGIWPLRTSQAERARILLTPEGAAVVEAGERAALVVRPLARKGRIDLDLERPPSAMEAELIVGLADGLLVPRLSGPGTLELHAADGVQSWDLPPAAVLGSLWGTPQGASLWLAPAMPGRGSFPQAELSALRSGRPRPGAWSTDARTRIPSLERRLGARLPAEDLLLLESGEHGALQVVCSRFDGEPLWQRALPTIPMASLTRLQPRPVRAADSWVLPIATRKTRTRNADGVRVERPAELILLRLSLSTGSPSELWRGPLPASGAGAVSVHAVPGHLFLMAADHLILFGDA